jgi:hypothetical protein
MKSRNGTSTCFFAIALMAGGPALCLLNKNCHPERSIPIRFANRNV